MKNVTTGRLSRQWTMPGDDQQRVIMAITVAEAKFLANSLINHHNESVENGQYCMLTASLLEKLSKDANLELEAK